MVGSPGRDSDARRTGMPDRYQQGQWVEWDWANGTATGKVADSFTERVERTIDGSEITRNADEDNPAYLIEQEDGQQVLTSHSELRAAND
jgi:hypothetical protein